MRLIVQPTLESIIEVNQLVCSEGGNPHQCLNTGKIESAISSAFYPGSYPFLDGNKRTGALVAITFLNMHGIDLDYPLDIEKDINGLAEIIEACAASTISQDQLKDWFETHKVYLDD